MSQNTVPELSPDRAYALKLAARELARYCEEFALWRKTKRGCLAVQSLPRPKMPLPHLMRNPPPPEPNTEVAR